MSRRSCRKSWSCGRAQTPPSLRRRRLAVACDHQYRAAGAGGRQACAFLSWAHQALGSGLEGAEAITEQVAYIGGGYNDGAGDALIVVMQGDVVTDQHAFRHRDHGGAAVTGQGLAIHQGEDQQSAMSVILEHQPAALLADRTGEPRTVLAADLHDQIFGDRIPLEDVTTVGIIAAEPERSRI